MNFISYIKKQAPFLILLSPGLLILVLFSYLPMFGAVVAFENYNYVDGFFKSPWVGLDNFKYLFQQDAFYITRNTVGYNLAFIILSLVFSVSFALIINELRNKRLAKLYQTFLFFPSLISWVIISYAVYAFLSIDKGFINSFLQNILGMEAVQWYGDTFYWPFILIFTNIWRGTGHGAVIYLANIVSIDHEYYESAVLDGANKWQQITKITLPLLKPTMIILTLLAVGRIFYADTGLFYQVPRNMGILYPATNVIDTYVLNGLRGSGSLGMTAAASFYQSLVGFILVLASNITIRKISPENALF